MEPYQITDLEAQNAVVADQLARLEAQLKDLQYNLKNAIISGLAPKVYNGTAQTQNPVITLNGNKLVAGQDYVIAYASNTNIGTATIIVSGKGNYTGSLQATFENSKY